MGHKKDSDELRTKRVLGQIQYELAKELGLGEEHRQIKKRMDAMPRAKCKVELAEANLGAEGGRKTKLNLRD